MELKPIPVNFEDAHDLLMENSEAILFDVRDESEYIVGHAEEALLFQLDDINADTAARNIPSKDTPVIVYCKSGRRAAAASQILCSLGYEKVYDLGSLIGWPYGIAQGD